jgi:uncharacterized membrane protein YhaH (DUF805 family)
MADLFKNKWFLFYFSAKGRATRYDFNVYFGLVALAGMVAAGLLDYVLTGGDLVAAMGRQFSASTVWNYILIVPTFAVSARRLHDLNLSGLWQIPAYGLPLGFVILSKRTLAHVDSFVDPTSLNLIAVTALFVLILFFSFFLFLGCKRGTAGPNKFGPDPLETVHDGK